MRKSGIFALLLTAICCCLMKETQAEVITFEKCPTEAVERCQINSVDVDPCAEAAEGKPCKVKRGKSVSIQVDFTPQFDSETLTANAVWQNGVLELPLPGMDTDACKTTECPLVAGRRQNYSFGLRVSRAFPSGIFPTKFTLQSDNGDNECCFLLKIQLK